MSLSERDSPGPYNFPSVNSYDVWVPKDFPDDLFLDTHQPLTLTPDEERLFKSFGDGLDSDLETTFPTNDAYLDEKQAVYAEAHAAGLFKGGIRRAAFSMGDLQALQPTIPVSQASRSPTPRAGPVGTSKAPKLESVPESAALPNPPRNFGANLMMESHLPERMSADMMEGLNLDQLPSNLQVGGMSSPYDQSSELPLYSDSDPMRASSDLSNLDLAMPHSIKAEPGIGNMTGIFPSSAQPLDFSGASGNVDYSGDMEGLDTFNSRIDFSEGGFNAGTQLPSTSGLDNMFEFPYMDVSMGGSDGRPPLAPRSPTASMDAASSRPTLDSDLMAISQQTFKEIPAKTKATGASKSKPNTSPTEAKSKAQLREEKTSARSGRTLHRSHSALELRSRALPSHGSTGDLQKSRFTVELTTPEGHTYTAGRLSNEERAQKILRYRQKRHERNFNKRIKYMCRKTLADSRPRVRGRFARNDDAAAVMPHETKKALAAKAKQERKAAEAAAAEYLRAQDRAAGIFPPNFSSGLPGFTTRPASMPEPRRDPSLSAALDFKGSRHKLTSDLSDLIPTSIPHVDSDQNLSSGTAFNFPQIPFNNFGMNS